MFTRRLSFRVELSFRKNKKNILFNFALVVPIFYLTLMVYTQLVGFHAALPYPESWVNELRNGEQLPPVKYWGFVVVTLLVPYAIYLVCTSFLALKFMFMPALLFGVFAALIG